ncbi:dephospho-CoA kinase [Stakelama sediminis]|uniref:Dephospho-CoA kinase n=1 Tax=Stakelama sediminis TaxID=463200 RepID=A0A840Z1L5_9SPHN|nr:dephospho-CoA kinase [Stakelama sediminis]MBB5719815.1 dephospho-CoA kinase [Stakelama sediminis]
MIQLGLTGSIGMGKSTVAAMFADAGVPVFDADAAVHGLQGPGGAALAAIETAFPGTTGPDGVDREALGARVLNDDAAMKQLEGIMHPMVAQMRAAFLAEHADAPLVVFDIPLLFETGGDKGVDSIAVVSAPPDVQARRVLARPGMTLDKFDAVLARQMPDVEKRARANHIIDTGGSLDATRAEVESLIACLRENRVR